jgi:hypothetical protein
MTGEYVRLVDKRQVQTSIRLFVDPGTDRQITVIGTFHLGEPGYYQGLREAIDKLEANGAVVHCEGPYRLNPDDDVTDEQHELLALLDRVGVLMTQRVGELGWTAQAAALGYPPSWQRIDLTNLEIIRRMGMEQARSKIRKMVGFLDWPDGDRNGLNRMRLQIALLMRLMSQDKTIVQAAQRETTDKVIVEARNEVALQAVAGTDHDTVLIWGLTHMPGLDAGLTEQGFVRSGDPQWHTVTRRPTIPDALWRLATRHPSSPRSKAGRSDR